METLRNKNYTKVLFDPVLDLKLSNGEGNEVKTSKLFAAGQSTFLLKLLQDTETDTVLIDVTRHQLELIANYLSTGSIQGCHEDLAVVTKYLEEMQISSIKEGKIMSLISYANIIIAAKIEREIAEDEMELQRPPPFNWLTTPPAFLPLVPSFPPPFMPQLLPTPNALLQNPPFLLQDRPSLLPTPLFPPFPNMRAILQSHLASQQAVSTKKQPSREKFWCYKCAKWFSTRGNLKQHDEKLHDPLRPFECSHCSCRFIKKKECLQHEATHARLSCNICHKVFSSNTIFHKHYREEHIENRN